MTLPGIVGLVGFKGSGQEAFADVLVNAGCTRAALADVAERECAAWLGMPVEELKVRSGEFRPMLERRMVERREKFPGCWRGCWRGYLSVVLKMPKRNDEEFGHFVVPDIACADDAEYIQSLGGVIVRVVKSGGVEPSTDAEQLTVAVEYDHYVDGFGEGHLRAQALGLPKKWGEG